MGVPVRARVLVNGDDLACDGLAATCTWGRPDVEGQPESQTASVAFADPGGQLGASVRISDRLQLVAVAAGREWTRFAGFVSDVTISHAEGVTTVQAQGLLARLARVKVGDTPWPDESDGDRVLRILQLVGAPAVPALSWAQAQGSWAAPVLPPGVTSWRELAAPDVDPGTVTIMARDVDAQPATQLLRDVADSSRGVIFERRNGQLAYHDADRRTWQLDATTPACLWLADQATFTASQGLMLNDATVAYGAPPAAAQALPGQRRPRLRPRVTPLPAATGGQQPEARAVNRPSVDAYGPFVARISTQLRDEADAQRLARRLVAWGGQPRWAVSQLQTDSARISDQAGLATLLGLDLGDTLAVEGIAAPAPAQRLVLCVEGATETLEDGSWSASFALSDLRQSVALLSWADHAQADPGRTWAAVPAGVPWWDADGLAVGIIH